MKKIRTFEALLEQYVIEKPLSEATISSYTRILHCFTKDTKITHLDKVSLTPLLEWRLNVIHRTSDITWNTYLRHMRALWKFAIMKKYVPEVNHFKALNWGRIKSTKAKTISNKQLKEIIAFLSNPECDLEPPWFWKTVVKFLYYTGVRRKQLVTLRWSDLDFEQKVIHLSAEGEKTNNERTLPLKDSLISSLKEYQLMMKQHHPEACNANTQLFNITLLYDRYKGHEMTEEQVSGFFRRLKSRVDFSVSPHKLRHTMATEIARTGQIKPLQQILGHSNITTTMNFYVHPDMDQLRSVMNDLSDI